MTHSLRRAPPVGWHRPTPAPYLLTYCITRMWSLTLSPGLPFSSSAPPPPAASYLQIMTSIRFNIKQGKRGMLWMEMEEEICPWASVKWLHMLPSSECLWGERSGHSERKERTARQSPTLVLFAGREWLHGCRAELRVMTRVYLCTFMISSAPKALIWRSLCGRNAGMDPGTQWLPVWRIKTCFAAFNFATEYFPCAADLKELTEMPQEVSNNLHFAGDFQSNVAQASLSAFCPVSRCPCTSSCAELLVREQGGGGSHSMKVLAQVVWWMCGLYIVGTTGNEWKGGKTHY